jgi:hypothetical protein
MVNFCVHKNLLFHHHLLSPCIVMCEIYLISSIAILFVLIVSNIGNEWNVIVTTVTNNILLFLSVYKKQFNALYHEVFFLCQHQL